MIWCKFIISAAIIIFSGIRLTTYADMLSDRLGLGKVWMGIVLLGFVTSLPEMVTSLASVAVIGASDLAIGNLLGSNNFNPMLVVIMDAVYRKGSVTNAVLPCKSHNVAASLAIVLASIVGVEILMGSTTVSFFEGRLSVGSILIVVCYFIGMRYLAVSSRPTENQELAEIKELPSLRKININLLITAILVVVGASLLANSAEVIAQKTGLGRTFVGTFFLAIVTSLPELVVSLSALRLGALDLAIGNIFGSNMTNMFIVPICAIIHKGNPILSTVAKTHVFTALLGIILSGVVLMGIHKKNKKTILGFGWDSLIMIVFFLVGTGLLYNYK